MVGVEDVRSQRRGQCGLLSVQGSGLRQPQPPVRRAAVPGPKRGGYQLLQVVFTSTAFMSMNVQQLGITCVM